MGKGDDFENFPGVKGFRGELRNSNAPIINIKIKDADGTPAYKFKFRTDDNSSALKFLRILKDKFGINNFYINDNKEENIEMIDELKHLEDWREKTKGLRDDEDFTKKMREAFTI